MIRTGILSVPKTEEACNRAVQDALLGSVPHVVVVKEADSGPDKNVIEEVLRRWCDELELDLLITIGGTLPAPGPSAREVVPEATRNVVERLVPGLSEVMRLSAQEENPLALLDRGLTGIRSRTLIVNLPAGVHTAPLFLEPILDLLDPMVAHLQERPDAPLPENWFRTHDSEPDSDTSRGLNAADFEAFLRRNRPDADA